MSKIYNVLLFRGEREMSRAGKKTRLATVAATNVSDVSQPSACVPPKELKQKMIKPAINTMDV